MGPAAPAPNSTMRVPSHARAGSIERAAGPAFRSDQYGVNADEPSPAGAGPVGPGRTTSPSGLVT